MSGHPEFTESTVHSSSLVDPMASDMITVGYLKRIPIFLVASLTGFCGKKEADIEGDQKDGILDTVR